MLNRLKSLNVQLIFAAIFGVGIGAILNVKDVPQEASILYLSGLAGTVFVALLKMVLIPLVFLSISVGVSSLKAHVNMGKIWRWTFGYFVFSMALAIATGMVLVHIFKPGVGADLSLFTSAMASHQSPTADVGNFLHTFIVTLFQNPIAAMAEGKIFPVVIFAIFLGVALIHAPNVERLITLLQEALEVVMKLVQFIMRVAPIGIMGLLITLVATQNMALFQQLGLFMGVVIFGTLFHGFVNLPIFLKLTANINLFSYWGDLQRPLLTAFSTSSSSATLPTSLDTVQNRMGVDKSVAGFVLPLGATVNMDGTALYEAVAALFIANLVGMHLSLTHQLVICAMAMVAAVGAPGIPSAGMVTMIMVLQSVGLPVEAVAILLPIDRILDTVRTTVNVEGDIVGALAVNKWIGASEKSAA